MGKGKDINAPKHIQAVKTQWSVAISAHSLKVLFGYFFVSDALGDSVSPQHLGGTMRLHLALCHRQ